MHLILNNYRVENTRAVQRVHCPATFMGCAATLRMSNEMNNKSKLAEHVDGFMEQTRTVIG